MTTLDRFSVSLLQAVSDGLHDARAGYEQHFSFEIRGKKISGSLIVKVDEKEGS